MTLKKFINSILYAFKSTGELLPGYLIPRMNLHLIPRFQNFIRFLAIFWGSEKISIPEILKNPIPKICRFRIFRYFLNIFSYFWFSIKTQKINSFCCRWRFLVSTVPVDFFGLYCFKIRINCCVITFFILIRAP